MAYPDNVYPLRPPEPFFAPDDRFAPPKQRSPLTPTQAHRLFGNPKPREFIAGRLFAKGELSVLYGPEGIGKSRFVMQLQVATATGKDFLGLPTRQCRSLALYGEDKEDQLHELRDVVCDHYKADPTDLLNMTWLHKGLGGEHDDDPMKVIYKFTTPFSRTAEPTDLWNDIKNYVKEKKIESLTLDNAGLVFEGETNPQVTRFLMWLDNEAEKLNISIKMLGHPSKAHDNYYAGVAAWGRRPRLNLSLELPPKPDGKPWYRWERKPNKRVLKVEKGSYFADDDPLKIGLNLRTEGGILKREEELGLTPEERKDLDLRVITLVKKFVDRRVIVYRSPVMGQCFSHLASNLDGWKDQPPRELDWSIDRLVDLGLLASVEVDGRECLRGPGQEPLPGERLSE